MKNKLSLVLSVVVATIPLLGVSGYFLLKNLNTSNLYLALISFACAIGSITLVALTFLPDKNKN